MPSPNPLPASSPLAFLSDIHGNLRALDAVLAELARQAVTDIFVAGDLVLGGSEPLAVWKRLQSVGAHCVRGTSDAALGTIDPSRLQPDGPEQTELAARFADTRRALGDVILRRLAELPERLRLPLIDGREILLVHGSPADPMRALTHDLDDDELHELLAGDPADIVVCGASHVPFARVLDDVQVLNVGSVGQAPEGAFAHYTLVFPRFGGPLFEQAWVEY